MNENQGAKLKVIDYHGFLSAEDYENMKLKLPDIMEIPAGLDSDRNTLQDYIIKIKNDKDNKFIRFYGLHTQEPYTTKMKDGEFVTGEDLETGRMYESLVRDGKLWKDEKWVEEFIQFIVKRTEFINKETGNDHGLKYIEVHPPKTDLLNDKPKNFFDYYEFFIRAIHQKLGEDVEIFMENSNGSDHLAFSKYKGINEYAKKMREIKDRTGLKSYIALDIPLLLKSHNLKCKERDCQYSKIEKEFINIFTNLRESRDLIRSVHLWGYNGGNPHNGDLNSLFYSNKNRNNDEISKEAEDLKNALLKNLKELLDDGKERYLLLELNNSYAEQRENIIKDLRGNGFQIM